MAREKWSSRIAFIVAAIGSAIGFGNIWRFPNLAFKHGGGAFFIPYILALFIIGIPILILEITIGQFYQTGDAGAFGFINKRFRGIGLASVLTSFMVTSYYSVLLAWVLRMFVYSCQGSDGRWANVAPSEGFQWFLSTVTGLEDSLTPSRIVGPNVGALAIVWVVIFLCIGIGIKWTGRIAYFTVGLPVLLLFVLLIRAVTLDGSSEGIKQYIGEWDVSVLSDQPEVWSEAVSQVFFSLSVTFGVMTAYSSYNKRNSPVFSNSLIIAFSNSLYSIIAGFAVFGTVGYLAQKENVSLDDKEFRKLIGGPALVFGAYPVALSTLPGGGHWERLLFVALFLLGIDSGFSLVEGFVTVLHDTYLFQNAKRWMITAVVSLFGFLVGLIYCTDTGLIFLDSADFYINFMMLLVGLFECFSVGWIYGIEGQIQKLGVFPVIGYMIATFASVALASGLWFGSESNEVRNGFLGLIILYLVLMAGVLWWCRQKKNSGVIEMTWKELLTELLMGNMLQFRRELVGVVRYIPLLWFFLIRHLVPQLLLILFANLAASENEKGTGSKFGHYLSYPTGYQAFGISIFGCTCFVIAVGLLFPKCYSCFSINTIEDEENTEEDENVRDLGNVEQGDGIGQAFSRNVHV